MIKQPFSRLCVKPSLVRVYQLKLDGTKEFKRYETPGGVPCDENGVSLGGVEFDEKGALGRS